MAKIVSLIAAPHDPTLPIAARLEPLGKAHPGAVAGLEHFATLRDMLTTARPDILVCIGSDHFGQWFMNNMPQFMVGKATRLVGPLQDEQDAWGLEPVDLPIHGDLARHILRAGLNEGVDFAFSDEFIADHSFTIPLNFLRPEHDLPVVPLFINLLAPPVPPGWRYAQVGKVVRKVIAEWDSDLRVAIIGTGHMSNAVGSPRMMDTLAEADWDHEMWALVKAGDMAEITKRSTWDQLYAHGNGTPGFLGNVMALGAADGAKPSFAELLANEAQPAVAFLGWSETDLEGRDT